MNYDEFPDVRVLLAFSAVAEHRSLTLAASVLGEAQSSLSRQISSLEATLGGRLFHRTGRGVMLTELGERLEPRIQAILSDVTELAEAARSEIDNPRGEVELGVVPGMSRPLVSELCAHLRRDYPRIRLKAVEAYSGEIEKWLASGRIQIGIFNRYGSGKVRGAELLMQSELVLVLPRGVYHIAMGDVTLSVLSKLPLALPTRPNGLVSRVSDLAARQGIALEIAFEGGNGALVRDAVEHAELCTLVPMHLAEKDYGDGAFEMRRLARPTIRQHTWLAVGSHRPADAATRITASILLTMAKAQWSPPKPELELIKERLKLLK
jgi:DNA-binding transcriptional LysR family regulator